MGLRFAASLDDAPVLAPLVADLQQRGEVERVFPPNRDALPEITLSVPPDPQGWAERYDLGPLLAWQPRRGRSWGVLDLDSGVLLRGGPVAAPGGSGGPRVRAGYAADQSWQRDPWRAATAADELEVLRRRVPGSSPPDGWVVRAVARCAVPVDEVLARVEEVLTAWWASAAPDVSSLPAWFVAACEPERDAAGWEAWFAEREARQDWRHEVRRARWTAAEWARSSTDAERVWELRGVAPLDERTLELHVGRPAGFRATMGSLRWLLGRAGVEECVLERHPPQRR